jgi:two-component sensor histidine kinase
MAVPLVSLIYSSRLKKNEVYLTKLTEERETLRIDINKSLNSTFAVISSMISMQILNSEEEETKRKLAEINDRIMSISLVHENLLQSKSSSKVNVREVFTKLGERLIRIYVLGGNIGFEVKGEECFIEMTRAVPLCIVMNEIISNSLKFAFTEKISGKISVEYNCRDDKIELCVRDNGIGIPEHLMCESQDSLGLNLIRNIVALQLNGSADLRTKSGTKWLISFPIECG